MNVEFAGIRHGIELDGGGNEAFRESVRREEVVEVIEGGKREVGLEEEE